MSPYWFFSPHWFVSKFSSHVLHLNLSCVTDFLCFWLICFLRLTLQLAWWSHLSQSKESTVIPCSLMRHILFFSSRNFFFLAAFLRMVEGDFFTTSFILGWQELKSLVCSKLKSNPLESLMWNLKVFLLRISVLVKSKHYVSIELSILFSLWSDIFKLFWTLQNCL